MLCDKLYTLLSMEKTETGSRAMVRLLPESEIYAAHFKGMPITPGACMGEMACELAARLSDAPLDASEASDIRFLHPVLPGETDELLFLFEQEPQTDRWRIQVCSGETLCARMSLCLKS